MTSSFASNVSVRLQSPLQRRNPNRLCLVLLVLLVGGGCAQSPRSAGADPLGANAVAPLAGAIRRSEPPVAPEALTLNHDGHSLRVWFKPRAGRAARGAILLLHGRTWSSLPDFDLQVPGEQLSLMEGLRTLGFDVYALDARGYGATPRDASGWLTPDTAAGDVIAVISWLKQRGGTHPLYLFGWSYGSLVGQLAAQAQGELLDGLIAFGYPSRPGIAVTPAELAQATEPPRRPNTAAAAASDFITPGTISEAAQNAFVAQALEADPVRVDWRRLEQWKALDPSRLRVPTLLIQGARDPIARPDEHARLFSGIAHDDKRWIVLPHGDHAAFMESSRTDFLRVIDTFTAPDRPAAPPATNQSGASAAGSAPVAASPGQ